ncbi:MAG: hypothetical protein AAFR52_11080, partial [Pseudomonadota bacterium]
MDKNEIRNIVANLPEVRPSLVPQAFECQKAFVFKDRNQFERVAPGMNLHPNNVFLFLEDDGQLPATAATSCKQVSKQRAAALASRHLIHVAVDE